MSFTMASDLESVDVTAREGGSRWLKVGLGAAATALAGGLAAVWWYRKTLARLREAEEAAGDGHFKVLDE
jgi:hypothetical protein